MVRIELAEAMGDDPFNLDRFVDAQRDDYFDALAEIKRGAKHSHWMWYVFPQIAGLGLSPTSQRYAIKSRAEAEAYLAHPTLGPRLVECCEAAVLVPEKSARQIFGSPDDLKLRSSATLFAEIRPNGSIFHRVLERFFDGQPDRRTVELLRDTDGPERAG